MIERLQHKYALSRQGAVDMIKACACVTLTNIVLMLPAVILYNLIKDMLEGTLTGERVPFYAIGSIFILILIALTNYIQYNLNYSRRQHLYYNCLQSVV